MNDKLYTIAAVPMFFEICAHDEILVPVERLDFNNHSDRVPRSHTPRKSPHLMPFINYNFNIVHLEFSDRSIDPCYWKWGK